MNSVPQFAVVGHPNKGKSSIVSTLTRQDAIKISELSGTTTLAQLFELSLNGQVQYRLCDTPGFQRPRQVLSWLKQHSPNAAERSKAIENFITAHQSDSKFHDEIELLQPIVEGAGIIYVVDGSLPYSAEFEAEMTILQWTGQPRMALINPIGGEGYVKQWRAALSQFFSVVRVFDPMTADAKKHKTVLSAFAELHEPWRVEIERTIGKLDTFYQRLADQGIEIVIEEFVSMLQFRADVNVPLKFAETALQDSLKRKFQQGLRDAESSLQRRLQTLYAHPHMQTHIEKLNADTPDLFDQSHWFVYGLSRKKIVALTTSAGAAAGAAIDLGVGGASMMTGAIAGGVVSGLASVAATFKPEKLKIKGIPLAGKSLTAGPVRDLSFAYVLLGRSLDFYEMIQARSHANRSVAKLEPKSMSERIQELNTVDQVKLTRLLQKAHKGLNEKELLQLKQWVLALVAQ